MTTKSTKPVTRETSAYVRDRGMRPVIITIIDSYVEVRAKGLRSREVMDIAAIYSLSVKARLARERAERKAKKGKK